MQLNIEETFNAMVIFLEKYYKATGSDDVGALLGDITRGWKYYGSSSLE